jgi:DNA-binding transcriptional MocR family regulator
MEQVRNFALQFTFLGPGHASEQHCSTFRNHQDANMSQDPTYGQYVIPNVEDEIDFKVGQPSPELLPLDKIRRAAQNKMAENDPEFLQYGNIYGFPKFRESVAKFLTERYGGEIDASKVGSDLRCCYCFSYQFFENCSF